MVSLREITRENHIECLKLKVGPGQEGFVASNAVSLAQSKFYPNAKPQAIYADDTMVGFLMTCVDEEDDNYWIWRLMVDARHQSKGYGREAMKLALEAIRADKARSKVLLSIEPENKAAEKLYLDLGFRHTGKVVDGEAVMQLDY
jgi:diamine N-acetyltransferase